MLGWRHDVIFTSGASEAVEIAAARARDCRAGRYGATEHAIVPHAMGDGVAVIPVGPDGLIDEARSIDPGRGAGAGRHPAASTTRPAVIQPLDRLAPKIREAGSLLLADCAQSAGQDAASGRRLHRDFGAQARRAAGDRRAAGQGPRHARAGGGQEKGYRRGTQDVPGALAFAAALAARPYDMERLAELRARLDEGVTAAGGVVIAEAARGLPTIGAVAMPGASSAALLVQFDLAGIAVSAGSACSSGKMKESAVLAAMGVEPEIAGELPPHQLRPATRAKPTSTPSSAEWRRIASSGSAGGMIYLDYQATTPVAPEVAAAMRPWIEEKFANPHPPVALGPRGGGGDRGCARAQVEAAIGLAAAASPSPAARPKRSTGRSRARSRVRSGRKLVTVATEHAAVLDTAEWLEEQGVEVIRLPVGSDGLVDLDMAASGDRRDTALVAVMLVNNEIGVIQPVAEIADARTRPGALMLCDAVQGFGRMAIPDGPDLVAVSGHKIHGPKGVGGLWMRDGAEPAPLLHGGGQEQGLRSGTLSPALCVGFGEAARLAAERRDADAVHVEKLSEMALATLGPGWMINGSLITAIMATSTSAARASMARG